MPKRYFSLNLLAPIKRQRLNNPNPSETDVTKMTTSQAQKTVNFIAGFALLVMLFPHGDKLPDKPAGVRTAIELVTKKTSVHAMQTEAAAAA